MRFFSFILTCLFFSSVDAQQLKVSVSAKSAYLINADTGAVLYSKDPELLCQPASTTKIATALYALEKCQHCLEKHVTATQEAVGTITPYAKRTGGDRHPPHRLTSDGTHMNIWPGEVLPLHTLFYGLMLQSGNDAANVIAEHVSGTIPKFIDELNAYLKAKGCTNTRFNNTCGLPHSSHITTAKDMALIAREAMKNPLFRQIVKTLQYPRPETNKQQASTLVQMNRLVKRGKFFYSKAIGIKTGTINGGYNLVGAAKDGDRTLIAVLFNCSDNSQRFQDAITLFEAAFSEKKITRTLLSKEHENFAITLKGAKGPVEAKLIDDVKIEYYPSEEPALKAMLHWDSLKLPISKNQKVGEIRLVSDQGQIFKTVHLFASKPIEMTWFSKLGQFNLKTILLVLVSFIVLASSYYFIRKKT